jgi:hypothetical protein
MSKYIPKKQLEPLMCKPGEEVVQSTPTPRPQQARVGIDGKYILMDGKPTYTKGVHALLEACRTDPKSTQSGTIHRPLTFRENLQVRINDYESKEGDEKLRLFNHLIDSCTGVAYKAGTRMMKIIPECRQLIAIDETFNDPFMAVIYDGLVGEELDLTRGKYDELLTKDEFIAHPAWLASIEGDQALLRAYSDIVFSELKRQYNQDTGMRFWVRPQPSDDELRALFVGNLYNDSNAYGNY